MTAALTTRPLRLYLVGPMSGLPDLNFPAFHAAAVDLRDAGYEVINPAELYESKPITNTDGPGAWKRHMRRDIPHLCKCDALATLPDWWNSSDARIESCIAEHLGMPQSAVHIWLNSKHKNTTTKKVPA